MAEGKKGIKGPLMLFSGIDIGSRTAKLVLLDDGGNIVFSKIIETVASTSAVYSSLISAIPVELRNKICKTAVTGYGRESAPSECLKVTEITCHHLGVTLFHPGIRTIIDIGGQDSKIITVDTSGRIRDFIMNDRCAAGTGRFLEVMCGRIGYTLEEFADLDISSVEPVTINSTCTVFAESEVISLISKDVQKTVIASSLARMASLNTFSMASKLHPQGPFFMSGGVSRIKPVVHHLEKNFASVIKTDNNSQYMGAIGAAVFALRKKEEK